MGSFSSRTIFRSLATVCFLLGWVSLAAHAQKSATNEANAAESARGDAGSGAQAADEAESARKGQAEIRRALQGRAAEADQSRSSGDPLLDDVLQTIRRRGSILDGTALDPNRADAAEPAVPEQAALPKHPAGGFRTAESLLQSARLLETLPHQDAARQQLVRRLRQEASRCLRQALSTSSPGATQETEWTQETD